MNNSLYIVRDTPDKGKGMFATQDIKRGTCIISEAPLVFVSPIVPKTMLALETMSKKNKKYLLSLSNIYSEDEMPNVMGIIKTNALPLGQDAEEGGVYRVISRINHSCASNVRHTWNSRMQKEYIHATEDIAAGDEIFTSYLATLMPRSERLKQLQEDFRFECRCKLCTAASSEDYDTTVTRINECSDLILKYASSNPRKSIGYVREVLALLDKAEIWGKTAFYYDGYQISAMYGNYELAQEWADLLLESHRLDEGEESDLYQRYLKYSMNPRSHERAGRGGYISLKGA
ncbi:hypothetical protein BGX27_000345 [Mortierella sp. AM989]|nr:hypothetical protein BGX27_000345 [Mortierella sp. AM989]